MGEPVWPVKRPDGTVSVTARFSVADAAAVVAVRECVSRWITEKGLAGVDLSRDLLMPPYVEQLDASTVEIVFDAGVETRMWRDWLVDLSRNVRTSVDRALLDGFQDRVSGVFREHDE